MRSSKTSSIAGCILAGGQSRRMDGDDKSLKPLGRMPMIAHVLARLAPQTAAICINANGDPARFDFLKLPVVADPVEGFAGPLAGVLAGLLWAQEQGFSRLATAATDTPFFPADLVEALASASADENRAIVMARSGGRQHPVFGLWPVELAQDLADFLATTDTFKVMVWAQRHELRMVEFKEIVVGGKRFDPFFNVNTPQDLALAEDALQKSAA